jgi:hypothetical protein
MLSYTLIQNSFNEIHHKVTVDILKENLFLDSMKKHGIAETACIACNFYCYAARDLIIMTENNFDCLHFNT